MMRQDPPAWCLTLPVRIWLCSALPSLALFGACGQRGADEVERGVVATRDAVGQGDVLVCALGDACPDCTLDLAALREITVEGVASQGTSARVVDGQAVALVPGSPGIGQLWLPGVGQLEVAWGPGEDAHTARCHSVRLTHRAAEVRGEVRGLERGYAAYVHGCNWKTNVEADGTFTLDGQFALDGGACDLRVVMETEGGNKLLGPPVEVRGVPEPGDHVVLTAPTQPTATAPAAPGP